MEIPAPHFVNLLELVQYPKKLKILVVLLVQVLRPRRTVLDHVHYPFFFGRVTGVSCETLSCWVRSFVFTACSLSMHNFGFSCETLSC